MRKRERENKKAPFKRSPRRVNRKGLHMFVCAKTLAKGLKSTNREMRKERDMETVREQR